MTINYFVLNDTEFTDQNLIANAFNDYFANTGSDLAGGILSVNKNQCLPPSTHESFFLISHYPRGNRV